MDNITLRPHWMQYALCEMPLIMLSFIAAGITIYFYDSKYEKYMELHPPVPEKKKRRRKKKTTENNNE